MHCSNFAFEVDHYVSTKFCISFSTFSTAFSTIENKSLRKVGAVDNLSKIVKSPPSNPKTYDRGVFNDLFFLYLSHAALATSY